MWKCEGYLKMSTVSQTTPTQGKGCGRWATYVWLEGVNILFKISSSRDVPNGPLGQHRPFWGTGDHASFTLTNRYRDPFLHFLIIIYEQQTSSVCVCEREIWDMSFLCRRYIQSLQLSHTCLNPIKSLHSGFSSPALVLNLHRTLQFTGFPAVKHIIHLNN